MISLSALVVPGVAAAIHSRDVSHSLAAGVHAQHKADVRARAASRHYAELPTWATVRRQVSSLNKSALLQMRPPAAAAAPPRAPLWIARCSRASSGTKVASGGGARVRRVG